MKVLITGGAGYIGSVLTPYLLKKGYSVTVLDNLYYKQDSLIGICHHNCFEFLHGDARDEKLLQDIIPKFDIIIPLACLVGAPACDKNRKLAISSNYTSIKSLIKYSSLEQKIIFPTTNSGYGIGMDEEYCTEKSHLNPISLYGKTKVDAEKIILDAGNALSLRLATVFGVSPRMRMDLIVNDFVYKAFSDGYLVLFEEHFKRNFIHIHDVAKTFDFCIDNFDKMLNESFNVGLSSANITKRELAEIIKNHIPDLTIISSEIREDPDKRDYIVSNEKLEKLGWQASKSLDDGIIELIKCYKILKLNNYSNN